MKIKLEITQLILWSIAISATFFILQDTGLFRYLGPVYLVCMIGSIISIRKARLDQSQKAN